MYQSIKRHFDSRLSEVDPDRWETIFVVGDVHGCAREFRELLDKLNLSDDQLLLCVGDIITKGPNSDEAVEIVEAHDNIRTVKGNGEAKYLRGDKRVSKLSEAHREAIESWPLMITWPGNVVVHGGFNPRKSVFEHDKKDVLNMRSPENDGDYDTPFWFDEYDGSARVFFGHSATRKPIHERNIVGLDTGCVYGNQLTAFNVKKERFVSVESNEVYQQRDPAEYVDTHRPVKEPGEPSKAAG